MTTNIGESKMRLLKNHNKYQKWQISYAEIVERYFKSNYPKVAREEGINIYYSLRDFIGDVDGLNCSFEDNYDYEEALSEIAELIVEDDRMWGEG